MTIGIFKEWLIKYFFVHKIVFKAFPDFIFVSIPYIGPVFTLYENRWRHFTDSKSYQIIESILIYKNGFKNNLMYKQVRSVTPWQLYDRKSRCLRGRWQKVWFSRFLVLTSLKANFNIFYRCQLLSCLCSINRNRKKHPK
jgi:hypothetical protein